MKNRRISISLLSLAGIFQLFLLFSCASTDSSVPQGWYAAASLDDIRGYWLSTQSEYEYPILVDGKKYLRYALAQSDDSRLWIDFAQKNGIGFEDLWEKRFAYAPLIYGEMLPLADANGSQRGRKFFVNEDRIYSKVEFLIPERLVISNLRYFFIKRDRTALMEHNYFRLASNFFPDIKENGSLHFSLDKKRKQK